MAIIVNKGQVEQIIDDADGLRIKVRLESETTTPLSKIPYAFPLLPKTFQSVPKEGEGALVLLTKSDSKEFQRYYIGPIISQPQFQEYCDYKYGNGNATSVLDGGTLQPLVKISNYKETVGAFPRIDDVAVVGRGSQDLIMRCNEETKSNEVDIRCGARTDAGNENNNSNGLIGKIVYNALDPAYIQLKYKKGLTSGNKIDASSIINIVADKTNIISHKDSNSFDLTNTEELIPEEKLAEIMEKLHQLPYGDILVEFLDLVKRAIINHVHSWPGTPPVISDYTLQLADWDLERILSEHVRIS